MKANIGNLDKNIRIGLVVIIFAAGLYAGSWWGLVGFLPLLTGLINFCPLYTLVGMNTCEVKQSNSLK
jgi:hypothetical protein